MAKDQIELTSPVLPTSLNGALAPDGRLQCAGTLTEADCAQIEAFLLRQPDAMLRVYKKYQSSWRFDIGFLANLPSLRHVWIEADAGDLNDWATLAALPPKLRSLTLDCVSAHSDKTKDRPKRNTQTLERLVSLNTLSLCGQLRDLGFLEPLTGLRHLELWRCKLKSLAGLEAIAHLEHLRLHASGAKDIAPLTALGHLSTLEIWDQRTMTSLSPIAGLAALERLWLISCGSALTLPSFAGLSRLKVLVVSKLANRSNLHLIAQAPALRCLILDGCRDIDDLDAFAPLAGHPTLQEVRVDSFDIAWQRSLSQRYGWTVAYANFPADEHL